MANFPQYFYINQGPPRDNHIIEFSGIQRARQSVENNISSKRGNLYLLIGTRGIGKSTCLLYLNNHIKKKDKKINSYILDIGLNIPNLLRKGFEERVSIILEEMTKCLSNGKHKDILSLINDFKKLVKKPIFLFIDNLDRLYLRENDIEFVKYFFQTTDAIFKELSKNVAIYISCAPEWNKFLEKEDLSYLNFSNSIELNILNNNEIKNLIQKRSESFNYSYDKIINENVIDTMRVASRGNPRFIFQFLEKILKDISKEDLPITQEKFEKILGPKLLEGAIEKLREIAPNSSKITWGINQLWHFFDTLQKRGIDNTIGIDKLIIAHVNSQIQESEIRPIMDAWVRVSHPKKEKIWVLSEYTRETITQWYKATKIKKEILLTAFSTKPFTLSTSEIEELIDDIYRNIIDKKQINSVFNDSLEGFMYISSLEDLEKNRMKLIQIGWKTIWKLMISLVGIEEGDIPILLYAKLKSRQFNQVYAEQLLNEISILYSEMDKLNVYRSDIRLILERFKDINKHPEIIARWDSDQIISFKHQVLTSYEGLLNDLKPYFLERTSKRDYIKFIDKIIKEGENNNTEFKSSMIWDNSKKRKNNDLKTPVLKTIVSFLNTGGGRILLGINDTGNPVGIDKDISSLSKKNFDGYNLYINDAICEHIGAFIQTYIKLKNTRYYGHSITVITVKKSAYPVHFGKSPNNEFIIRAGNSNRKIVGNDMEQYIKTHFKEYGEQKNK